MQTKAKRRASEDVYAQPAIIAKSIGHLKIARDMLRRCGAKNAADYVARTMKSAEGALRHAERMRDTDANRIVSADRQRSLAQQINYP